MGACGTPSSRWGRPGSPPFAGNFRPPIVGASIKAIELLTESTALRDKLQENTRFFREELSKIGLKVLPGEHPIVSVMFGEAMPAVKLSDVEASQAEVIQIARKLETEGKIIIASGGESSYV